MFQTHFEKEDTSTINLQEENPPQQSTCKIQLNSVLIFIVLAFLFLIMAMIQLITNYQELDYTFPLAYDPINNQIRSPTTYVMFTFDDTVSLYLDFQQITQFSFTNRFDGGDIEMIDAQANNCNAYRRNKETLKSESILNTTLNPNSFSIPCGKYPSLFLGTQISLVFTNGTKIPLKFDGINVFQYNVHDIDPNLQWTSIQHPLFKNWMEQNVKINTHKLIGKINGRFEGMVYLEILQVNQFPADFGPMTINLTNNKALGGSDTFFCGMSFAQSALMFLIALLVYLYHKIIKDQVKSAYALGERKIQLRSTNQSQLGKTKF